MCDCQKEIPPLKLLLSEVVPLVNDHADLMWDRDEDEVAHKWWDWLKRVEAAMLSPTPAETKE